MMISFVFTADTVWGVNDIFLTSGS